MNLAIFSSIGTYGTVCAWIGWILIVGVSTVQASPLQLVQTIPLPGVEGRIDHLALDAMDHRLYVAALGNDTVEVINLDTATVIHEWVALKEPQGLAVVPVPHEIVVTNGGDGSVRFYDPQSWQLTHSLEVTSDADNIRYDLTSRLLYVGFGNGGIAIINPQTHLTVAVIPLSAHPEAFALEDAGPHLFVNVPMAKRIEVLNRTTRSATGRWNIATDFEAFFAAPNARPYGNFPMVLDEQGHHLFVGYRQPPRLQVFDIDAQVPVAQIEISGDADDILYDSVTKRLYVACGEGFIDVIERTNSDSYKRIAKVATSPGARTALWDSTDRRLYLAVPHRGAQASAVQIYEQSR